MTARGTAADGGAVAVPSPPNVLPATLEHVLGLYERPVAAEAARVVRVLMSERLADPAPDAWRGSRLTGDGFPVEVAFSTTDDRLRLTVEPGPERLDPRQRLDLALGRLAMLGCPAVPPDVSRRISRIQARGPLRYGAWVAGRVSPDTSVLKLYAEVPDPRVRWPDTPDPVLDDRSVSLRMLGYTPATGVTESYLRVPSLTREHLPALLAPVGLAALADGVVAAVETLYGHPLRGRLPGPSVGVSYLGGVPEPRVTLHFYARALWGGDDRIRTRFAEAAAALGWDARRYLALTAPLAGGRSWRTRHGIVGLTLDGSSASMTVGVRPVAP